MIPKFYRGCYYYASQFTEDYRNIIKGFNFKTNEYILDTYILIGDKWKLYHKNNKVSFAYIDFRFTAYVYKPLDPSDILKSIL